MAADSQKDCVVLALCVTFTTLQQVDRMTDKLNYKTVVTPNKLKNMSVKRSHRQCFTLYRLGLYRRDSIKHLTSYLSFCVVLYYD